jgi:hypothetical protein
MPLRIEAMIGGVAGPALADAAIDIREQRWAVLFHDPRPSWMSTFVRRVIERDARFVVTSRVITSRNLSTDVGRPPSALDDARAHAMFDAVVVGAPEALTERDVAGLERFMRSRGGSVVLLLDRRGVRGPYERLTGVRAWAGASSAAGFAVTPTTMDSGGLRASEIAWPTTMPPGARPIAWHRSPTDTSIRRPIVWDVPVGAGRLIVSGALDAWRLRDAGVSRFNDVWRSIIADAADRAPEPVMVAFDASVVAPGERVRASVDLRAALGAGERQPVRSTVAAVLEGGAGAQSVRMWPDGVAGQFVGTLRAPAEPGTYRLTVTADGFRSDAFLLVTERPERVRPDDSDLVAAWVGSRDGGVVTGARLPELAPSLDRAVRPGARAQTWHPMRSAWWIVAFAALLGAEWWARRRAGLS